MKRILDPEFRYVPSLKTDVRKTFERVRREQCEARERQATERQATNLRLLRLAPQKGR